MNLGIIYKDNKMCNHRSLLKVCVNPFLRMIGFQIATKADPDKDFLGYPILNKCPKKKLEFSFNFKLEENMSIVKKRTFI